MNGEILSKPSGFSTIWHATNSAWAETTLFWENLNRIPIVTPWLPEIFLGLKRKARLISLKAGSLGRERVDL
jgi:hypothetical protein